MNRIILPLTLVLAAACTGRLSGGYYATASTPTAQLVEVRPGVYAVADYDEPVFFADNYYWRYNSGNWYRSNWYTGGWVSARPPVAVLRIDSPHRYARYRAHGNDRIVIRDRRGHWHRR